MSDYDQFQKAFLTRQEKALNQLPDGYFEDAENGQNPDYISVECGDSREHPDITHGAVLTDLDTRAQGRSIGANVVTYNEDGEPVVDGSVEFFVGVEGVDTVMIADHYACGAVKAAIEAYTANDGELIEAVTGVETDVKPVMTFIDSAVADGDLDYDALTQIDFDADDAPYDETWADAVEQNVIGQAAFLQDRLPALKERYGDSMPDPEDVNIYPAVNDFVGLRGRRGRTHFL